MNANKDKFGYDYEPEEINKVVTLYGTFDEKTGQWYCGKCKQQLIGGGSRIGKLIATMVPVGGSRVYVRFKEIAVLCGHCFSKERLNVINYLATSDELEHREIYHMDTKEIEEDTLFFRIKTMLKSKEFKKIKPKDYEKQRRYIERKLRSFND